jgi:hypothetical protein
MFDYSLKKLSNFTEHTNKSNALTVVVRIKKWEPTGVRDEKQFMSWLNTGCRQVSDNHYEITKV